MHVSGNDCLRSHSAYRHLFAHALLTHTGNVLSYLVTNTVSLGVFKEPHVVLDTMRILKTI